MKVTFRLRFRTRYGQSLLLRGSHPLLGAGFTDGAIPLRYVDLGSWEVTVSFVKTDIPAAPVFYEYILRDPDGSLTQDWGRGRELRFESLPRCDDVLILDTWISPGSIENAFYTEPFQKVLLHEYGRAALRAAFPFPEFQPDRGIPTRTPGSHLHTFKVRAPLLTRNQTLCLLGDAPILGNWNTSKPTLVSRTTDEPALFAQLDLSQQALLIAYKYGIYDLAKKSFVRYEDGPNRLLDFSSNDPGQHTVVNDGFAAFPSNTWKGAGVAIPVFSLRTERSFGVGEFLDLKTLADWGSQVGLKLIQILPVNDTTATHTWRDSYPYSAISAFALHPIYLNLERLADRPFKTLLEKLEPERQRLNALEDLDYETGLKLKLQFLRQCYPSQREQTLASESFRDFFARNRHWLAPYAAFCYLRDKHGTADFSRWPDHRHCTPQTIRELTREDAGHYPEIAFHYFVQFHLHLQLKEASAYAHSKGLIMKGDIPIGVYRNGVDDWQNPDLYKMDLQAGAPPDPFADKGQNWSFPTYNWKRMKEDGYAWWKQRFEQMSGYFDAFRIDHILGFFRIWSIPCHAVEGILGYFDPAIPVDAKEFKTRGIWFDRERYTRPYITDEVLSDLFLNDYGAVRSGFLQPGPSGTYSLKPEFATQRLVEDHFAQLEPNPRNKNLQQGLYDLISNVILLEVEGSHCQQFHFRFGIEHSSSFENLPAHTREQLKVLYTDYFYRRQDDFWRRQGMEKLPALKRVTNMLICGEDLGMVPDCVPGVMKELGLLSLEVQRMPKIANRSFVRFSEVPYLSVVTSSTHDMSTIRGWWEEDRKITLKFYNEELGQSGEPPKECEPWINKTIVRQHLSATAMWSIFQLQDLLGMDGQLRRADPSAERINIPANPKFFWHHRMHLSIESLQRAESFNMELKNLIQQSGR